jgi:multidrug efflux pump subunit AcrB/ABC-type multidrug transport system ATPase subunit
MLRNINNRPITVLMVTLACCMLGILSWQRLPVQLLPELVFPEIQVNTSMPNAYPEQLEREAVALVESEITSLDGVSKIESNVFGSAANTTVAFDPNTDMKFAVIKLQQKMNAIQAQLPEGARITINRFDTSDLASFLMQINLRGPYEIDVLREVAERRIRPRLEQVDGVVDVSVGGGQRSTVDIVIDPDRCEALNIPIERVRTTVNAYHQQQSHLGRVLEGGNWLDITLQNSIDDIADLRALLIDTSVPIRLDQVAWVGFSTAERTELYRVSGKSSVGLFIRKDQISNMLTVSDAVLASVAQLNEELLIEDIELVIGANQAEMIQQAIDQLETHAVTGLLLALIVLFLFLRSIRFVSVLILAIPVSLLVTFNLMYAWNLSVNILSLCGLALAIGMLVDNGIVVLENVFRRYQRGESGQEASVSGTREMARSIFAATVTTVLVFLPVLFVENQARLFVRELALSVIFPLVVSLLVALTVIPLLAGRMLKDSHMQAFGGGRILEIYRVLLKTALRYRIHTIITVALLFTISVFGGLAVILSQAPAPSTEQIDVYITAPRGATLDATDAITRRIESQIEAFPSLEEFRTNVQPEEAHITVEFLPLAERTEPVELPQLKDQLARQNRRLTGVTIGFGPPQSSQSGGSSGGGGGGLGGLLDIPRGLRLRGHDMTVLRQLSEQLTQTMRTIPEVNQSSVQSDLRPGAPELQIRGDRNRLARAGMTMATLMQALPSTRATGMNANTPFTTRDGDVSIRFVVLGMDENQPEDIENITLRNINGQPVRIREVSDVRMDEGEGNITRYNQARQVRLSYDFIDEVKLSKTRLDIAEAQVRQLVETFRLPDGFVLEPIEPENEQAIYYWIMGIGALLIYMFLAAQFESLLSPLVILGTIPTAIIGAFLALSITGTALSMGDGAPMALLGLIVLLGIVVNNGIILLDRISVLRHREGYRWQRAVLTAGQQRVRPIVMTSVTTMLGVFPLALKQGTDLELWPPFAITILGGLTVSTFSTLIFIPVLYVGLEQTKAWCKEIGAVGLTVGTVAAVAFLTWAYFQYPSALVIGLLALPCWFIIQGFMCGVNWFIGLRQARIQLTDRVEQISIRNLTKIYGLPDRFRRDWRKQKRRLTHMVNAGEIPWTRKQLFNQIIWLGALGILLVYLHTFVEQAFWIMVLSLVTLVWLAAIRDLWYASRFVMDRPPAVHQKGTWRRWIPQRIRTSKEPEFPVENATPLTFSKRGGLWFIILLVAYQYLRSEIAVAPIAAGLIGLLLYQLYRIGRRIEHGHIDPEQPTGRLRKIKHMVYALVRMLPIIRPPVKEITALNRVNLDIGRGMFGLLGPNGAGKTTLMRILVGVLNENRGSIFINGQKLAETRETFHGAIGYLPQDFGLYEHMTPNAYLDNHALINGIYEKEERQRLIDDVLHGVGLWERRDDRIRTFSGGMKQRVGIAQTLLHMPQIIVVDEPTVGLDPRERIRFRNLLAELAKDRIVIFSTHIVEDISSTCHDLAVLFGGEVLYRGSPEVLQQRAEGKVFESVVSEEQFELWRRQLHIVQHSRAEQGIRIRFVTDDPDQKWPDGLEAQQADPTLEDAYVSLLRTAGAR